jgi:hypothetical protein
MNADQSVLDVHLISMKIVADFDDNAALPVQYTCDAE